MPKARVVEVNASRECLVAAINDDPGFAIVLRQEMLDKVRFVHEKAFGNQPLQTIW